MEFLDDDLDVLDLIENGFPRRVYERANYYEEMDNLTFFQRFRLTKPTAQHILVQIEHLLEFDEDKNNCMTPINQLLLALRFYATDGHLSSVADFMGVHVATACRVVKKVSYALAMLKPRYIKMPENHDIIETQNKFFQITSFPRVIGCIDGTHVKIQSPGGADGEIYRNRKGYFSVNVQVPGIMQKLTQIGINNYIPLPSAGPEGTYALPIISTKNPGNVAALGATQMLSLGPVRTIPRPGAPNNNVKK